jgi:hypothetical protein
VSIGVGITANFVTAPLTARLEGAARVCEVAGIVVGLATGLQPLVIACVKLLAHDELGIALSRELEQIINSVDAEPEIRLERDLHLEREAYPEPEIRLERDLHLEREAYPEPEIELEL